MDKSTGRDSVTPRPNCIEGSLPAPEGALNDQVFLYELGIYASAAVDEPDPVKMLKCSLPGPWVYLTEEHQKRHFEELKAVKAARAAMADLASKLRAPGEIQLAVSDCQRVDVSLVPQQMKNLARAYNAAIDEAAAVNGGVCPFNKTTTEIVRDIRSTKAGKLFQTSLSDAPDVRPLAAGVDTLWVHCEAVLKPEVLSRLEKLKVEAETRARTVIAGDHRFDVKPYGGKPAWAFILEGPTMTIRIRRRPKAGNPTIQFELRSAFLWTVGPIDCTKKINDLLSEICNEAGDLTACRVDLAVDFQGYEPTAESFLAGAFVTRSTARAMHFQGHKAEEGNSTVYYTGRVLQGLSFGRGDISARIYCKSREIKRSKKGWMNSVWNCARRDSQAEVWRLEFQLRGDGLKTWLARKGRAIKGGRKWVNIFRSLDGIWAYLTGRDCRGWLTLRVPTGDKTRARWPVAEEWKTLASLRWPGRNWKVERIKAKKHIKEAPQWVTELRRRPSARIDPVAALAAVGRAETVANLVEVESRALWNGKIFNAWKAGRAGYLTAAEQRAAALKPQAVGLAVAITAAYDAAGNAFDAPSNQDAIERVLMTMREAMAGENIMEKLSQSRDRQLFKTAWAEDLAELERKS